MSERNLSEMWQSVLGELELQISKPNFLTWLKQSELVSKNEREGEVLIGLPNNFAKEWVRNKYHKLILGSLRNLDSAIRCVDYAVLTQLKEDTKRDRQKLPSVKEPAPQQQLADLHVDPNTNLNPRYALNLFVVGSSNEFAHAAVQAVVENVGKKYNPLFIYGGVGLGKTHLLQGAGNEIVERYEKKVRVLYVTSERFINDVVWALRHKRMEDIKNKYRDIDVLIIDDIQYISGKAATEQEFFYTFNVLHEHNKQIILSSDRPPAAIPTLEERLRSRFEGGMIADISYPDYELRLAILKNNLQQKNIVLENDVLEFIASKVQRNIRELEGVLNKVIFYQQYKQEEITVKKLEEIVSEAAQVSSKNVTVNDIIKTVAEFFEVSPNDITNRSRKREIVEPRQICMYLLRDVLKFSYPHIGEKVGKRDHTTAMHACVKISRELNKNPALNQKVMLVKEHLYKM